MIFPVYSLGMPSRRNSKEAPTFGKHLSFLRKERGLTQAELAIELRISPKMVDYYERRSSNPSSDFVKKAAQFFGVSVVSLITEQDDLASRTKRKPGPKSKLDIRVEAIKQLSPRQQDLVFLMIDSFLEQARKAS
ncbi:MAG: helix-turn-helix transcriptional regulator [Deltaproteobacteria bacterium]|nr:helix-turn-helix transcriptional regulator [Deltaproteobacteria bacterium]